VSDTGDSLQADDGTIILYHGEAERKIARQTIEDHLEKLEASIRARLPDNRRLTPTEARKGLYRKPMTEQEKLHSELTWQSLVRESAAKDQPEVNPHQARLDKFLEDKEREEIGEREWALRQDVKKWNEDQAAKKARDEMQADPHRIRALQIAQTALTEAKYNDRISASTLDTMGRLVGYIREGGDLEKARQIQYNVGQQVVKDMGEKIAQTSTQIAQYQLEQKMLSEKFNLPAAVVGEAVSQDTTNNS
jgi:hypothetical protein